MATLQQLRDGLERAWDTLAEGWHYLRERTSHALTRFHPRHRGRGQLETADEQLVRYGSRWGLLAAEVVENDADITVKLEIPGMDANDFEIQVVNDVLVVRGEKRVQREEERGRYHVMERAYGYFERAIPLPVPVNDDAARATYRKGVLRITLPKAVRTRTRRIEVKGG